MAEDNERREPADVEPVRHGGLRFEAPFMANERGERFLVRLADRSIERLGGPA